MDEIAERIREFVVDNYLFGQTSTELADEGSFMQKGIFDSTGVLELVFFLETTFDIKVEDEDLAEENLDSIKRASRFVQRKLSSRHQGGTNAARSLP